jgi:hypothetical protein
MPTDGTRYPYTDHPLPDVAGCEVVIHNEDEAKIAGAYARAYEAEHKSLYNRLAYAERKLRDHGGKLSAVGCYDCPKGTEWPDKALTSRPNGSGTIIVLCSLHDNRRRDFSTDGGV